MNKEITLTPAHFSRTMSNPAVQASLAVLKVTARTPEEVEDWIGEHLPLFSRIPLEPNDTVRFSFSPRLNDLSSLKTDTLGAYLEMKVFRKFVERESIPNAFMVENHEDLHVQEHYVSLRLALDEWPWIIANLLAHYRYKTNFDSREDITELVRNYMDPYLQQHFPGISFDKLKDFAGVDMLPDGAQPLIDFLFQTRSADTAIGLPHDMAL